MNNDLNTSVAYPLEKNNQSRKAYYMLTDDDCRQLYKLNLMTASAYIYLIVRCHGKAGWKWTFTVKDFCSKWEINERTFYRAVSNLKSLELLQWETKDTITVWYENTSVSSGDNNEYKYPDTDDSGIHDMSINTLTPMTVDMTPMTVDMTPMSEEKAGSCTVKGFQNPSYLSQTFLNFKENIEEEILKRGEDAHKDAHEDLSQEKPLKVSQPEKQEFSGYTVVEAHLKPRNEVTYSQPVPKPLEPIPTPCEAIEVEVLESTQTESMEIESFASSQTSSQGQIVPRLFEKVEQANDQKIAAKARAYWEKTGIVPKGSDFNYWRREELGADVIAAYRLSGNTVKTTNDYNPRFLLYVAKSWEGSSIGGVVGTIRKSEQDPTRWEELRIKVLEWKLSEQSGNPDFNVAAEAKCNSNRVPRTFDYRS